MIPDLRAPFFRQNWVRVKNGQGSVIPPHSCVVISSTTYQDSEFVHTVIQPNASSTVFNFGGYLVTGPFALGPNTWDETLATSLHTEGFVRVNGSPSIGSVWGPKHGQYSLEPFYYGFLITGTSGTSGGNTVALAKWEGIPTVKGKVDDTNVSVGNTCTVSVWTGNRNADTGMNVTSVYNPGADLTSVNGKLCQVSWTGGQAELIFVQC